MKNWYCDFCRVDHPEHCPLGFVPPISLPADKRREENAANSERHEAIERLRDAAPLLFVALSRSVEPMRLLGIVLGPERTKEYLPGLEVVRKQAAEALAFAGGSRVYGVIRDL